MNYGIEFGNITKVVFKERKVLHLLGENKAELIDGINKWEYTIEHTPPYAIIYCGKCCTCITINKEVEGATAVLDALLEHPKKCEKSDSNKKLTSKG